MPVGWWWNGPPLNAAVWGSGGIDPVIWLLIAMPSAGNPRLNITAVGPRQSAGGYGDGRGRCVPESIDLRRETIPSSEFSSWSRSPSSRSPPPGQLLLAVETVRYGTVRLPRFPSSSLFTVVNVHQRTNLWDSRTSNGRWWCVVCKDLKVFCFLPNASRFL